ncbi:HNH endonuclease [bacterium BMS3Abin13]|nr:HNH endonuclease [bacterium BMS3Abin13]
MRDVELVLRFASFYHQTYLNYKPPVRKFLNSEMERNQFISDTYSSDLRNAFKNSIQIINSLLGKNSFKRFYRGTDTNPNGYWEPKKFNASLFDILMYSFARENKNIIFQHLDEIREAFIHLMTSDQGFIDSIELSTSSLQAVTKRFDRWRLMLQEIVGVQQKEERCFSNKLKQELFSKDSACAICGNTIQVIDDSAVDHIQQYWQGGKTIPENARLTHRYCNWSRPRKE